MLNKQKKESKIKKLFYFILFTLILVINVFIDFCLPFYGIVQSYETNLDYDLWIWSKGNIYFYTLSKTFVLAYQLLELICKEAYYKVYFYFIYGTSAFLLAFLFINGCTLPFNISPSIKSKRRKRG